MCAVKCVKLSKSTNCVGGTTNGATDWSINCDGITVQDTSVFSDMGTMKGSIVYQATSPNSISSYCLCKMIQPAVSVWISTGKNKLTTEQCVTECASFLTDRSMRDTMFDNIQD